MFSGTEAVPEDNGHKGEVTGCNLSVMGTNTDIDDVRGGTGDTLVKTGMLGKAETGTRDETEDVTSRRPDGVLIGCKGVAPT